MIIFKFGQNPSPFQNYFYSNLRKKIGQNIIWFFLKLPLSSFTTEKPEVSLGATRSVIYPFLFHFHF